MSRILPWTEPMDSRLRRLRTEGESWRAVASDLQLDVFAARARGRRLGLPEWSGADVPGAPVAPEDPRRPPLPTGHERSWRILTDGTLLEGTTCMPAPSSDF